MSNKQKCPFLPNKHCKLMDRFSETPKDTQHCICCLIGKILEEIRLIRISGDEPK